MFRIGNATKNITWKTYQDIAARPDIAWIVPISLGDSHHGFRVMGTKPDYFSLYHYRHGRPLEFASGAPFSDLFDAVIGADVAAELGYKTGELFPCDLGHSKPCDGKRARDGPGLGKARPASAGGANHESEELFVGRDALCWRGRK